MIFSCSYNKITLPLQRKTVDVVQLVRTLDCGSRGRRFEPDLPPEKALIPLRIRAFLFYIDKNFARYNCCLYIFNQEEIRR